MACKFDEKIKSSLHEPKCFSPLADTENTFSEILRVQKKAHFISILRCLRERFSMSVHTIRRKRGNILQEKYRERSKKIKVRPKKSEPSLFRSLFVLGKIKIGFFHVVFPSPSSLSLSVPRCNSSMENKRNGFCCSPLTGSSRFIVLICVVHVLY